MQRIAERYHRLASRTGAPDLENGFAARVHDPLWMLARQWQLGEHQGENASSPVRVECQVTRAPIAWQDENGVSVPRGPAEALVETELDDWWTMGRRIRVGNNFEGDSAIPAAPSLRFDNSPPPYDAFTGRLDGRAIWRARSELGISDAAFGADRPPANERISWDTASLHYDADFVSSAGRLEVKDHEGGPMDWFAADALATEPSGPDVEERTAEAIPTPLEYPGAPHSRFWEIEDARVDIGGYPPDSAHFATMLLVDLIYSHGDDWFLFPVTCKAGHVEAIRTLVVTDSFGHRFGSSEAADTDTTHADLDPPDDFSVFRCNGLDSRALVLWTVAELPIESAAIERVQFGVDEHANLLWALERIVDAREVRRDARIPGEDEAPYPDVQPISDLGGPRLFRYRPQIGAETGWHPYELDREGGVPEFVQRGLADYSLQTPKPMPHPRADVLKVQTAAGPVAHRISAATMAGGGFELERRWQMARDLDGNPVLWIQRQRRILRDPPARVLRFDVLEEAAAAAE